MTEPIAPTRSASLGESDPFVDAVGGKSYFVTPPLRQRIDLIRHLIEFGRQIVVLTGPVGAGKSSLLAEISETQDKSWHVANFVAGPTLNRATLLSKLADEFQLESPPEDIGSLVDSLRAQVRARTQRGEVLVLAVDEAHALPADTMTFLPELAHALDEASEIRVLLAADPTESALVDQLQRESSHRALIHVVEIPRFTDEHNHAMLKHRWNAAYGTDDIPLAAMEMSQIHQQSNGIPGKAIVLARQVLMLRHKERTDPNDPAKRYIVFGVGILAVLLLFAFFYSDDAPPDGDTRIALERPSLSQAVDHDLPVLEKSPLTLPSKIAVPDEAQHSAGDSPLSYSLPSEDEVGAIPLPLPPIESVPLEEPAAATQNADGPPSELIADESPAIEPMPLSDASPASPTASAQTPALRTPTIEAQPPIAANDAPISDSPIVARPSYSVDWLRQQSAGGYVLQLFGVRERAAAAAFIEQRNIQLNSAIFRTEHAGAPWYVVLYGHYGNRKVAQAAIKKLPDELATTKPWARPISSIR